MGMYFRENNIHVISDEEMIYHADVSSANDYYAFGMLMPERVYQSGIYAYSFNGMYKDSEIGGEGNSLDFGARIYDSRLGRWLSRDPRFKSYPVFSLYLGIGNNPLVYIDPDGEKLILGGQRGQAEEDSKSMLPTEYRSRVRVKRNVFEN